VESGSFPHFTLATGDVSLLKTTDYIYLSGIKSDDWYAQTVDYYKRINEIYQLAGGKNSELVSHRILSPMLVCSEYANGLKIYINFSKKTQTYNGIEIDGLSYSIGGVN
jgi:hypothetical protein